jgi:aminoglycoside phosphotransferase (APT) family kinase protein
MAEAPPPDLLAALRRMGLLVPGASAIGERLTGGVSSDIWRIELPTGPVCVKRALPKLRVAADWQAPVERNRYEARWMRYADAAVPGSAPRLLGLDETTGTLAMQFLPPDRYPLWKAQLRDGHADPAFATQVAATLAGIHAATAADPSVAAEFPTDGIFHDIRLEPYLVATARAHRDMAEQLQALVTATQANKRALVHGDVSPKNILRGPDGPVFLDAECAWWGDPAFDLAFCLNHLLLKCLWTPSATTGFLACFAAMTAAYAARVTWEPPVALETRAARLLPGLFLARVDGKSPVEYITTEPDRNRVRRVARALLVHPVATLGAIRRAWTKELAA